MPYIGDNVREARSKLQLKAKKCQRVCKMDKLRAWCAANMVTSRPENQIQGASLCLQSD